MLGADLFEIGTRGRIELCFGAAVLNIDLIDIVHQLQRLITSDILMHRTTEVVGDIVLSVRKSAGAAEAAHDRTGLAFDAGLHLVAVDGTFSFLQCIAGFKDCDL